MTAAVTATGSTGGYAHSALRAIPAAARDLPVLGIAFLIRLYSLAIARAILNITFHYFFIFLNAISRSRHFCQYKVLPLLLT